MARDAEDRRRRRADASMDDAMMSRRPNGLQLNAGIHGSAMGHTHAQLMLMIGSPPKFPSGDSIANNGEITRGGR